MRIDRREDARFAQRVTWSALSRTKGDKEEEGTVNLLVAAVLIRGSENYIFPLIVHPVI